MFEVNVEFLRGYGFSVLQVIGLKGSGRIWSFVAIVMIEVRRVRMVEAYCRRLKRARMIEDA